MAKTSGLTTSVTVASNDISNDITNFSVDTPYGEQDITGLDKSAIERLLLRADCTGTLNGVFNTASNKSHATLKTPGSKTFVIVFASSAATLTFTAVTTNYAVTFGADGSLTWSCNWGLSSGTAAAWT
jgi:hypothetical protein